MNGAEHYAEAQRLIERANGIDPDVFIESAAATIGLAQVHATLALAAATADAAVTNWLGDENRSGSDWARVIS